MRTDLLSLLTVGSALVSPVVAHYRFISLVVGSAVTPAYQYVRQNSNSNSPVTDVTSTDFTCNVGARTGKGTQTYTVAAGSTIGFKGDMAANHPGVYIVYLGQAPASITDLSTWDGSGASWFKIYQLGPTFNNNNVQWPSVDPITFRLPTRIANGNYLVRIEQIALHGANTFGGAQFYISCAQIKVTGGSGGSPSKVSIPGVYDGNEPGIKIPIYWPVPTSYAFPGPNVYA